MLDLYPIIYPAETSLSLIAEVLQILCCTCVSDSRIGRRIPNAPFEDRVSIERTIGKSNQQVLNSCLQSCLHPCRSSYSINYPWHDERISNFHLIINGGRIPPFQAIESSHPTVSQRVAPDMRFPKEKQQMLGRSRWTRLISRIARVISELRRQLVRVRG